MALLGAFNTINRLIGIYQRPSIPGKLYTDLNAKMHYGIYASEPSGYYPPYAWSLPRAIGAMSSFTQSGGVITPSANMAGGRNLTGTDNSSITVTNAQLDQIVNFIASALLSMTNTNAGMSAAVLLQASALLAITTSANIGAIINALASSSGAITPNVELDGLANMTASAGGPTPLSPEALAQAVWDSLSASYNLSGSFGLLVQEIKADLAKKLDKGTFIALK